MNGRSIAVPDGMVNAARNNANQQIADGVAMVSTRIVLEAALRWLSENPIAPTQQQVEFMLGVLREPGDQDDNASGVCVEWQRRMFLAPEIPEEIRDLLYPEHDNSRLIEAFRRGTAAR